jgi:hypothetical protein
MLQKGRIMHWSPGSLVEVEADVRRAELRRAARARWRPVAAHESHRPGPAWRIALGRRLMRFGARLAGLDAAEHAPAL